MDVDFRIKWDPRADDRVAAPGDMVEAWVRWRCPLTNQFQIKVGRIGDPAQGQDDIVYQTVQRTNWQAVVTYFDAQGVVLPAQPSCPGY